MRKVELEEVLCKAIEYYFKGMNAKDAIAKSLSERSDTENEEIKSK